MKLFGFKIERIKREKVIYFGNPRGHWEYVLGEGDWSHSEIFYGLVYDMLESHNNIYSILKDDKTRLNDSELHEKTFQIIQYLYSDKYTLKIVTEDI